MMSARNRVDHPATLGLVLAGGLARRMGGGDKALIRVGGVALLDRVVAVLRPACTALVINANGDPVRFGAGLPVVPDSVPGFAGPLAGVLAGLDWAAANTPDIDWVASVPADCPFLPSDLVVRLHAARAAADADLAVAASGGRSHPVIGLWPVRLRDGLRHALTIEGERKVGRFAARYHTVSVEWSAEPIDPFFNINAPGDVAEAARRLACAPPASYQP
jgi:molybdopterin-guanine dinucleotide biosynthesis protein A